MKCLFGEIPFSVRVPIWWYWLVPNQRHLATEIHQCLKLVSGGLNLSLDNVKIGRSIVFSAQTLTGFQRKCETNQRWFVCFQIRPHLQKTHIDASFPPTVACWTDKKTHNEAAIFFGEQKHRDQPTTSNDFLSFGAPRCWRDRSSASCFPTWNVTGRHAAWKMQGPKQGQIGECWW